MTDKKKAGRGSKIVSGLIKLVFSLLILAILIVAALPAILSHDPSRDWLLTQAGKYSDCKVQVDQVSLSWFGTQAIQNLTVHCPKDEATVEIPSIRMEGALWKLLRPCPRIGHTTVKMPVLSLGVDSSLDSPSLPNAGASIKQKKKTTKIAAPFLGHFEVFGGTVRLNNGSGSPILIRDIELDIQAEEPAGPMQMNLSGTTQQDSLAGTFQLEGVIQGTDLKIIHAAKGDFSLAGDGKITMTAQISHFPVEALDRLAGYPSDIGPATTLLGNELNIEGRHSLTKDGFSADFTAKSPKLEAHAAFHSTDGKLQLERPATLSLKITPEINTLWRTFGMEKAPVNLTRPTEIKVNLDRLDLPFSGQPGPLMAALGRLQMGATTLTLPETDEELQIKSLDGSFNTMDAATLVTADLDLRASYQNRPAFLTVHGRVENGLTPRSHLLAKGTQAHISVEGNTLPLPFADALLKADGLLTAALGQTLNLRSSISLHQGIGQARLSVNSDTVSINDATVTVEDGITLTQPLSVDFHLSPTLFDRLADLPLMEKGIVGKIRLNKLYLPYHSQRRQWDIKEGILNGVATIETVTLKEIDQIGDARLSEIAFEMSGETLANSRLVLHAAVEMMKPKGEIGPWLAKKTDLTLTSSIEFAEDNAIIFEDIVGAITSERYKLAFQAEADDDLFALTRPVTLSYILTPELLAEAGISLPLRQPTTLKLSLEPSTLPLRRLALSDLQFKGTLDTDPIVFGTTDSELALEKVHVAWDIDGTRNKGTLAFQAAHKGTGEELSGEAIFSNWVLEDHCCWAEAALQNKLHLTRLPTALIGALIGFPELQTLVGDSVSLDIKGRMGPRAEGLVDIFFQGEAARFQSRLKVQNDHLVLSKKGPTELQWTLTPDRYDTLMKALAPKMKKKRRLKLTAPSTLKISLSEAKIPLHQTDGGFCGCADLGDISLFAHATVDHIAVEETSGGQKSRFENIFCHIDALQPIEDISFELGAQGSRKDTPTEVAITGKFSDLFDQEGNPTPDRLTATVSATIDRLPVIVASAFIGAEEETLQKMEAAFGQQLDAALSVQLHHFSGDVSAEIQGDHSQARLKGSIENGVLFLSEPLTGQMEVTETLSKLVLKDVNPLLITAVGGDGPITLHVEPEGFRWPLLNFEKAAVTVEKAILDFGKIQCTNGGPVGVILGLLKAHKLAQEKISTLWFTPQHFSVKGGVLKVERMDFLIADSFHLANWGKLDWPTNKVDMTLGLTAQTMRKAFGINIPKDDMFRIPMKGTTGKIQIDSTKTATRLAALMAEETTGAAGDIVGLLINAQKLALGEGKIPPPTTQPFPWEKDEQIQKNMEGSDSPSVIPKEVQKPIKAVEKEIKRFLKKTLFNP